MYQALRKIVRIVKRYCRSNLAGVAGDTPIKVFRLPRDRKAGRNLHPRIRGAVLRDGMCFVPTIERGQTRPAQVLAIPVVVRVPAVRPQIEERGIRHRHPIEHSLRKRQRILGRGQIETIVLKGQRPLLRRDPEVVFRHKPQLVEALCCHASLAQVTYRHQARDFHCRLAPLGGRAHSFELAEIRGNGGPEGFWIEFGQWATIVFRGGDQEVSMRIERGARNHFG